jgi:drug/metabolite transporter (DMT)-like permease
MIEPKRKTLLIYGILLFGILCIAWSAIFVKLANISGLGSAFYRMFIGTLGIIPVWLYLKKPLSDARSVRIAIICGILFGCDIAVWNTSIMLSKAAISTLLANLAPVWVGFGTYFFFKEKPQRIFWIGTLIALVGVAVIVGIDEIYHTRLETGHYLAICASIFYGAYLLISKKGRSGLDTVSFTAISMVTSTILLFIVCIATQTKLYGFNTNTWLSLSGLGLVSQLLGWLAINFTLRYIKPTYASVSLLSQSVFTALLSMPVLGEFLKPTEVLGAVLVLAGIYLVNNENIKSRINLKNISRLGILKNKAS